MTHKQVKLPLKIMADIITFIQKLAHKEIELHFMILADYIPIMRANCVPILVCRF